MGHVNWKAKPIGVARSTHDVYQNQLELTFTPELAAELRLELTAVLAADPGPRDSRPRELRLDLPESWTLYWKIKTGLSRPQLAHPQSGQWVASIHLTAAHAERLLEALAGLASGDRAEVRLSMLGAIAPLVNLDLVLKLG